jgi:SAM-dependent methyltransferase
VASQASGWWLHVDLDVLDGKEFSACGAASDPSMPEGLTWAELASVTRTALRTGGCRGWSIGVYNPDLDPEGREARRLVAYLAEVTEIVEADHQPMVEPGSPARPAGRPGPATANRPGSVDYDAELRLHNQELRRACGVRRHDHVLDVGCGTGQTTQEAARMAAAGSALGVDASARMIDRAREIARVEGLRNVTFERADAQVHRFPSKHFDLAISRFGTMFFDDPVAAFANIGRALRPAGRLVMMVWQGHERNEWDVAIHKSLEASGGPVAVAPEGPGPFSLADPTTVEGILDAAGFAEVTFTDVHEPVYYGPDVAAALDWVRGFTCTNEVLERLAPLAAERALERLRETLAAHARADGIWFDSRAWIVTARRR